VFAVLFDDVNPLDFAIDGTFLLVGFEFVGFVGFAGRAGGRRRAGGARR